MSVAELSISDSATLRPNGVLYALMVQGTGRPLKRCHFSVCSRKYRPFLVAAPTESDDKYRNHR